MNESDVLVNRMIERPRADHLVFNEFHSVFGVLLTREPVIGSTHSSKKLNIIINQNSHLLGQKKDLTLRLLP